MMCVDSRIWTRNVDKDGKRKLAETEKKKRWKLRSKTNRSKGRGLCNEVFTMYTLANKEKLQGQQSVEAR